MGIIGIFSQKVDVLIHFGSLMGHISTLENLWSFSKIGC
jgi:hypothetical protein